MTDATQGAMQPPESWIREYGNGLLAMCYAQLRDRQLAQDALQETLLKAWRAWQRKEGGITNQRAWLYTIAANTCRDMRKTAWHKHIDRAQALDDLVLTDGATPEDGLLMLEVMALPDKLRQAVVLYYYHSLTMAEIAKIEATTTVMIHRQLKKARELLKVQIGEDERHA